MQAQFRRETTAIGGISALGLLLLVWEATAVAKAAMDTGVAQVRVNLDEYRESLERRLVHEAEHAAAAD
jgi:hypothetical protein